MSGLLKTIREGLRDMCYIWAKEMRLTVMDEGVLIFFILVPLLYPVLYSWVYNNEVVREVPVAVVDRSHSSLSREFLRLYDASPDVKVAYHCNSLDEARTLIGRQVVRGVLYFPEDFDTRLGRMEQSVVSVYTDMSMMLYYKAIYQTAASISGHMNAAIQTKLSGHYTKREEQVAAKPLAFDEVPIFNSKGGYADFILPGVLMLILHQTLLLGIGLSAGTARESNRYSDLVPVSRHYNGIFRIVLGKSLCYLMVYSVTAAFCCLCIPKLFGFTQLIHFDDYFAFMLPYLLACIFFGMMLSCLVRYRENVLLLVVFTSVPLLFLSGVSWPLSNMPGVWQSVAALFPSTFGIRGFVRMNTMGATLADIQPEYMALWVQVVVYFLASCLVYRYQIIQARCHASQRISILKRLTQEAIERRESEAVPAGEKK